MARCRVCHHPADWHGDRAVSVCVLWDQEPDGFVNSYFMGRLDTFPRCPTCTGYEEDLPDLYLRARHKVAFLPRFGTIAAAPLAG